MFLSLKHNHRPLLIAITVTAVVVFGFGTHAVQAQDSTLKDIWNVVSHPVQSFILGIAWLVYGLVWMGGQILGVVIVILIWVASYNNFINERIVNVGWVLVRDLANMVFIIALLYMAFNMVFGIRGKGASLLTLIINAGLINFSKMIAGLLIDVSQVVMLTFVHGFYNIAAGNLLDAFGLTGMISMKAVTGDVLGGSQTAGAITILITILFALIMVYVAVGVVFTIIVVLLGRVFELWGLIIFSPMPYVGKFIPGLAQFTEQWWSRLSKALIVGPILAFFLWLSFTAVTLYSTSIDGQKKGLQQAFGPPPVGERNRIGATPEELSALGATGPAVGLAQAGSVEHIMAFIIMVGLLMMSLKYAQQFGAAGSDLAARWRGKAHGKVMRGLKTLGSGTLQASRIPAYATAMKNLALGRMPTLRRLVTKEGRAEKKAERYAGASDAVRQGYYRKVLKKPLIAERITGVEAVKQAQAKKRMGEIIEHEGLEDAPADTLREFAEDAIKAGDEIRARAIMTHMADKGFLQKNEPLYDQFAQRFVKEKDQAGFKEFQVALESKAKGKLGVLSGLVTSLRRDPTTGRIDQLSFKGALDKMDEDLGYMKDSDKIADLRNNQKRVLNVSDSEFDTEADLRYLAGITTGDYNLNAPRLNLKDPSTYKGVRFLQRFYEQLDRGTRESLAERLEETVIQANKQGVTLDKKYIDQLNNAYKLLKQDTRANLVSSPAAPGTHGVSSVLGRQHRFEAENRIAHKTTAKQAEKAKFSLDKVHPLDQTLQKAVDTASHQKAIDVLEWLEEGKENFSRGFDAQPLALSGLPLGAGLKDLIQPIESQGSGFSDSSGHEYTYKEVYEKSDLKKQIGALQNYLVANGIVYAGAGGWRNSKGDPLNEKQKKAIDDFFTNLIIYLRRSSEFSKEEEYKPVDRKLKARRMHDAVARSVSQVKFNRPTEAIRDDFMRVMTDAIKTLEMYKRANQERNIDDKGKILGRFANPLDQQLQKAIQYRIDGLKARLNAITADNTTYLNQSQLDRIIGHLDYTSQYYKQP